MGLGCWQLGADWGQVEEKDAFAVLDAAVESGVTFLDTADVYGDGRSETLIRRFLADRPDVAARVTVATKMGRRADPHVPAAFTPENFRAWTDRSRRNLGVDTLDLVQLHCPPTPETRRFLDRRRIALLPDGAIVVNTARGAIVDDGALIEALNSGKLAAAGLDVYENEPAIDPRYRSVENCFLLPHLGSATVETRDAMGFKCLDSLEAFFAGRPVPDRVV